MTEKEALAIIATEKLSVNWLGDHPQEPFEFVMKRSETGIYQVYGTDERAGLLGIIKEYTSLEEALDDLIHKARILKQLKEYEAQDCKVRRY